MTEEIEAVKETAKAVQEVAKTTGQAIEASKEVGGFISRFISGPLEQAIGIYEDKLKYMRLERQVSFIQKTRTLMNSIGIDTPIKPIPLKLAIPLFEAASLEDDDYLQDLWAKLLVNSTIENGPIDLNRTHIDILERLSNLEAKILSVIYALPEGDISNKLLITTNLPSEIVIHDEDNRAQPIPPNAEVILALANLARLGCISLPTTWGGGQLFGHIYPAVLGRSLVEACTLKPSPA
ncbi:hypothetical protein Nit79A3_1467 [Nitrosomonas sp. Is79A3]|uniref:Abi-alpha family protein n=1 Tax=Nitrosomonas sp. (strain Is79A3) TaxID=261292 RepID=UPI000215D0D9